MKHIVIDNNNFTILEGTKGVYPVVRQFKI